MDAAGTLLDDRYRLGPLLGEGGMAVVHRAHDEALDRDVAIKILRPEFAADPAFVRRFRQEARNAASLWHPAIVPILDTVMDGDRRYIVMQLVDGPDLERVIAERGRLPVSEAVRIAAAVADALAVAHENKIVHRDIKPANILLGPGGKVQVVDFGIARAMGDARMTQPGLMIGSIQYASPEQVRGKRVGPASDIYSLGVVFYEMLTGVRPFDGPEIAGVALERLYLDPQPPSILAPDLPRGLDDVVLRALQRLPGDRFGSAAAMAEEIRSWWRVHGRAVRRRERRQRDLGGPMVAAAPGSVAAMPTTAPPLVDTPNARPANEEPPPSSPVLPAPRYADHPAGVVPAPFAPRAPDRRRSEDRPQTWPLLLIPLAALLLVVTLFAPLLAGLVGSRSDGGVLGETGTPGPSAIARLPTASPALASTSSLPGVSPSPTPAATARPTPRPTPRATPRPTPRATARPTPAPAAGTTTPSPTAVVARFYNLVEAHRFDEAAALWTARMRRQYPPDQNIDGRFSRTTRIDLRRNVLVSIDRAAGTAVVAVDLIEYRTVEPSPRRFVGRWDLVLTSGGWRMDRPHF